MSMLSIPIGDNAMGAYIAAPKAGSAPVVIVCQEIFGVTPWLRSYCDRLAEAGFVAIAPDLFWRTEAGMQLDEHNEAELGRAYGMVETYDREQGVLDLKAAVDFARKLPNCNGKVAMLGFCLGGHLAFLAGCRNIVDAAVCYYPTYVNHVLDEAKTLNTPMLVNIAGSDMLCSPEDQQAIKATLMPNKLVELRVTHGAGHAYARIGGGEYNEKAAEITWCATMGFLAREFQTETPSKLLVRRYLRVLSGGDKDDLDNILVEDFDNTEAWHQPQASRLNGREGQKNVAQWLSKGFEDVRLEILDMVEENDTVAIRVLFSGVHVGEYRGLAGTGKYIERNQAHFLKIKDGWVVRQNAVRDDLTIMIQLGAIDGSVWSVYDAK